MPDLIIIVILAKKMTDVLWRLSRLGQEIERKEQAQ